MVTETEGIVLRSVKTANGRAMLHILTEKFGIISVGTSLNAKGFKSKSSLATNPFTYARYELYKGRETYNLNAAEVKKSFYGLSGNLDKYVNASFVLELTDRVLVSDVPEPRVFSLLLDFLTLMEKREQSFETLTIAYEIKLLGILGLSPAMSKCQGCGKEDVKIFSIPGGGMICSDCEKKFTENPRNERLRRLIYRPGFDIVNTVKYFESRPMKDFDKLALDESVSKELAGILREYFSYHLDVGTLKSESMM